LRKDGSAIRVNFNGADGSPADQFAAEYSASNAREKSQLI
jgi:hypothetical protein